MGFAEATLRKKWWRSDALWVSKLLYRDPIRKIPLYLDTRIFLKSQYWPREKISKLQTARLEETLAAAARIPMWRERFTASQCDPNAPFDAHAFSRLPLNSKTDFTSRRYGQFTTPKWRGRLLMNHTSGSTGKPLTFYQDGNYELRQYAICERMLRTATGGERIPAVAIRARMRPGFSLDPRHFFFLRGYNSIRHRLPQLLEHLKTYGGRVLLYGFSSALLELARACSERGITIPCKSIVASGEALQPEQRRELRDVLNAEVYLCYTTSELGWLGYECEHHRIHLNEESAYVEITDSSGVPLPPGAEGKIVVTPFDTRVMPFIRYDTGDRGIIHEGPCPCGRTLQTIEVWGRYVEYLTFADDRVVSLLDISSTFDRYARAVQQFQITQTGDRSITVHVIPRKFFETLKQEIADQLVRLIHPGLRIDWKTVETIPEGRNGKACYFVPLEKRPA